MPDDLLKTSLLDLAFELKHTGFPLILGGGYGLYLKQLHFQELDAVETLIPGELWPYPRSTEDLDLFLQTDLIASVDQMAAVRAALDKLNYDVVKKLKYMHFEKQLGGRGRVKIDLLTGPIIDAKVRATMHIKPPRVRPKGSGQLHAYLTEEAVGFDDQPVRLTVGGKRSCGQDYSAEVCVPRPFTFLLMKLHAFRDRKEDKSKELGRYHALDLYRIMAMLTEEELAQVRQQIAAHGQSKPVADARHIVAQDFANDTSVGPLRLREHELFRKEMDLGQFLSVLHELLSNE